MTINKLSRTSPTPVPKFSMRFGDDDDLLEVDLATVACEALASSKTTR